MCPWTASEIAGHDNYDEALVEVETIGGPVGPNPPEIMNSWHEDSVSVNVHVPPLEERRKNWIAETTVLAEVESVIPDSRDLVDYLIDFEDDIEGVGQVSLRKGDSFALCRMGLEGQKDSSIEVLTAESGDSFLAVAPHTESDSDGQEICPEIGLSRCPDWVIILEKTGHVLIDSQNFILDTKVNGRTCHFEGPAIVGPGFFIKWFASEFGLTVSINDLEWGQLVTHWYEMGKEREPSIVPVLISERLWRQLDQEIFGKICQALVDEGVRAGDWVNFVEVPSRCQKHSFGGGQT